jgi:hypothetical protein
MHMLFLQDLRPSPPGCQRNCSCRILRFRSASGSCAAAATAAWIDALIDARLNTPACSSSSGVEYVLVGACRGGAMTAHSWLQNIHFAIGHVCCTWSMSKARLLAAACCRSNTRTCGHHVLTGAAAAATSGLAHWHHQTITVTTLKRLRC